MRISVHIGKRSGAVWIDKLHKARKTVSDYVPGRSISFQAHADRVGNIQGGCSRLKLTQQINFLRRSREKIDDRVQMATRHGDDPIRLVDHFLTERPTPMLRDIDAQLRQDFDSVRAWRLARISAHTRR